MTAYRSKSSARTTKQIARAFAERLQRNHKRSEKMATRQKIETMVDSGMKIQSEHIRQFEISEFDQQLENLLEVLATTPFKYGTGHSKTNAPTKILHAEKILDATDFATFLLSVHRRRS